MKIIVSHDVDHLDALDHLTRDLILPKLWARSLIQLCQGKISLKTFWYRLTIFFHNRMNRTEEVMAFDRENGVPSVFFFGMDSVLGMSYPQKKAKTVIHRVLEAGFDAGVHGADYQRMKKMQQEHDDFAALSGTEVFGIRTHYVRFDMDTFEKMNMAGYLFDSSWFNKEQLEFRAPYRVGNMWEFPLHIMDSYICHPGTLEADLQATYAAVRKAEAMGMPYCTILFHDNQYDDRFDPQMKQWYEGTIHWLREQGYTFISYRDAIKELEECA